VASSEGSRSVTALRRDDDPVYGSLAAIDDAAARIFGRRSRSRRDAG